MKIRSIALTLVLSAAQFSSAQSSSVQSSSAQSSSIQFSSVQSSTTQATPGMKMPAASARMATQLAPSVQVSGLYVAAVPSVATESAAYLTLKNTGKTALILTGVSSPAARVGMLMTMKRMGAPGNALDMTAMKMVTDFALRPGQSLTFAPSGAHLMLSRLTGPLSVVGQTVPITLNFRGGAVLRLAAPVRRLQ
ncbi:copper chaperone PCu(A)C [Deinococcus sp.]|uniref:copper chaperone PCu(A)C n=1 Tax=Deinococcus sp. TaxID=47478 RepID=UPI0025CB79C6|nr:copper chaperone PCu(A)C [Deinococcus sp.]